MQNYNYFYEVIRKIKNNEKYRTNFDFVLYNINSSYSMNVITNL